MELKGINSLDAGFLSGLGDFRFVVVVAVFVVNVSGFAVVVVAIFVVNVTDFAVVVSATGAVDVSGFAVRRSGRNFAAESEEGDDASDEQEGERADGDEGRRSFRLIVVVFFFGHFEFLGLSLIFVERLIRSFFNASTTIDREIYANGDKAASETRWSNDLKRKRRQGTNVARGNGGENFLFGFKTRRLAGVSVLNARRRPLLR